jgi:hypothetical protein
MKTLIQQLALLALALGVSVGAAVGVASGLGIVAHLVCVAFRCGWQWVGRWVA